MEDKNSYTISLVQEKDEAEVLSLLRRTFYVDEPLNAAVKLCEDTANCPEIEEYCTRSLKEGLSFKATSTDGKIVGVTISGAYPLKQDENGNDLLSQAERCKNPKFQKILYILAKREEGARLWEKYPDEKQLVEVMVAATDPQWRRKGIMNALLAETEKAVKQRNIRLLRCDTSSAYSAKSAERMGFTCVYKAKYTDLTDKEGNPLIVPDPPHVEDRVNIKELNVNV